MLRLTIRSIPTLIVILGDISKIVVMVEGMLHLVAMSLQGEMLQNKKG
jgi:hypothetical protein